MQSAAVMIWMEDADELGGENAIVDANTAGGKR
jgi:hypothetical protein